MYVPNVYFWHITTQKTKLLQNAQAYMDIQQKLYLSLNFMSSKQNINSMLKHVWIKSETSHSSCITLQISTVKIE